MNTTKILNAVLILIPVVCFLYVSSQLYTRWRHINQVHADMLVIEHQITVADRSLAMDAGMPAYKQAPTATQSAAEQARFLDQLHGEAAATGVQITTWMNSIVSAISAAATAASPQAADPHQLPPGVIGITSQVEVAGSFQGLRQFLYNLQRTPRLLNLSSPRWTRGDWPLTHLTFTLTRYVTPEAAPIQAPEGRVAQEPNSPVGTRSGS